MNKFGTAFLFNETNTRRFTSFCNSTMQVIFNSEFFSKLFEMSPILLVRRRNAYFSVRFSIKKAAISIEASKPPISSKFRWNMLQYFGCGLYRFRSIPHLFQKLCKRSVIRRNIRCFSTADGINMSHRPLSTFPKKWNDVIIIIRNKIRNNLLPSSTKRNMSICPNKAKNVSIDTSDIFRYSKLQWIYISFFWRFIQFAFHNIRTLLVSQKKSHCFGIDINSVTRSVKSFCTISSTENLVVLSNEI